MCSFFSFPRPLRAVPLLVLRPPPRFRADFYEAVGVDALALVEHCGLRPMAGKLRAGFPVKNIQEMLDQLTDQGFSVAVYEELPVTAAAAEKSYKQRKMRTLAQIVSPMSSLYMHNLTLKSGSLDCRSWKPVAGVLFEVASGFQLVAIDVPLKRATVETGLTLEGVFARLHALAPASPLYVHCGPADPMGLRKLHGLDDGLLKLRGRLSVTGVDALERQPVVCATHQFVDAVIRTLSYHHNVNPFQFKVTRKTRDVEENDVAPGDSKGSPKGLRHLSPALARQIGISPSMEIPSLLSAVLPRECPPYVQAFLRRWLLSPPPFPVADAMQELCKLIPGSQLSINKIRVVAPQKVALLIETRQCNADTFRDIAATLHTAADFLAADAGPEGTGGQASTCLWTILQHQYGVLSHADLLAFRASIDSAMEAINAVIPDATYLDEPRNADVYAAFQSLFYETASGTDAENSLTTGFCEKQELVFRHRVRRDASPVVEDAYDHVENSVAKLLEDTFASIFRCSRGDAYVAALIRHRTTPGSRLPAEEKALVERVEALQRQRPLKCNLVSHQVYIRGTTTTAPPPAAQLTNSATKPSNEALQPALDRRGKRVVGGFTSDRFDLALSQYSMAIDQARTAVHKALVSLCELMEAYVRTISYASTLVTVIQVVKAHSAMAIRNDWCIPTLEVFPDNNGPAKPMSLELKGITPYWLPRGETTRQESRPSTTADRQPQSAALTSIFDKAFAPITAIPSDLTLDAVAVLTAPNMAGKSSLLRSIAAVAVLGSCGLYVPCTRAKIPRFDGVYMQIATTDIPTEGRSSFGQEMANIATVLQEATPRSLVLLDELGHGTSHDAAVCIAGAVVETLLKRGCLGVFSTHLHQLFDIGLELNDAKVIHMDYDIVATQDGSKDIVWNYRVADGKCEDSFGLLVARHFGLPEHVLNRATALQQKHFVVPKTVVD